MPPRSRRQHGWPPPLTRRRAGSARMRCARGPRRPPGPVSPGDKTGGVMPPKPLPRTIAAAIDASSILGVRAGANSDHRFIGVWPIVIGGRVFARSWSLKPGGWYRTFLDDPRGDLQVGERTIRVRAVPVRSERLRDA